MVRSALESPWVFERDALLHFFRESAALYCYQRPTEGVHPSARYHTHRRVWLSCLASGSSQIAWSASLLLTAFAARVYVVQCLWPLRRRATRKTSRNSTDAPSSPPVIRFLVSSHADRRERERFG